MGEQCKLFGSIYMKKTKHLELNKDERVLETVVLTVLCVAMLGKAPPLTTETVTASVPHMRKSPVVS